MKNFFLLLFVAIGLISACSDGSSQTESSSQSQTTSPEYEKITFSYKQGELPDGCRVDSAMMCAIELAAKCTINPKHKECDKNLLPSFIFMEDESLQRPTEISFRVYKLKPLQGGIIEAYTESSCNGGWFGLCQGNVIYVLSSQGSGWKVNDIYSLAQ